MSSLDGGNAPIPQEPACEQWSRIARFGGDENPRNQLPILR